MSITRWIRPTALTGLTTGLRYAGCLGNGRKVYSNLRVVRRTPEVIVFEGAASAGTHSLASGSKHGQVVTTWRTGLRIHFQSSEF
jgi:hypothetical protein